MSEPLNRRERVQGWRLWVRGLRWAATASIDELWVCDYSTVPAKVGALREQIATSLASTYEVPVNLGRPEVTRRDEIDARVDRIFLADGRMPPRYQEYAS